MERNETLSVLRDALSPVFQKYNVRRAVLFGSFGKGTQTEQSDVDLLVDSGLHGLRFMALSDEVRSVLGREVDLFDTTHIEPDSRIDAEISHTGMVLYKQ